jgi:transcription elongation factor GreA
MDHQIVLTPQKYKELQEELERLISVERPAIAQRIRVARELGDLSENFDYQDAKRQQGFLEGRINNVRALIDQGHVEEYQTGGDTVGFGSKVKLYDIAYEEELEYTIVGVVEADPAKGLISTISPLGKALIGQKVGAVVEVATPAGADKYRIDSIV